MRIDINAGKISETEGHNIMILTLSHELTHYAENFAHKEYADLQEFVFDALSKSTGKDIKELIAEEMEHQRRQNREHGTNIEVTESRAKSELVARGCELVLTDAETIRELAERNRGLFGKIKAKIIEFTDSIINACKEILGKDGNIKNDVISKEAMQMKEYAEKLRTLWSEAVSAAVEMSRKLSSKTEPKNTISTKQSRGENVKADSKDISNYKEINIEDVFEKLSDGQKNEIEVINKISEATGVKVKYFESKAGENGKLEMANGFFDRKKNEIWIDINAGRNIKDIGRTTMVKTMSHELTHFIAKWSEEQYGSLEKYVLNLLEEKTGKAQKELIKDKMKQLNVKEDVAREEIIADACEMMLKDSKAIEQLAKENRTLFNKIKEWLHNFVESIKKAFEGVKATSEEAKAIMEYMEDVQEKWDNTMVEAVKNMNNIHHKGVSTSGKDYKETINSDLAEFVERNKIADQKETYRISEKISMKLASDIKTLLGIDVSDYANEIDSDSIIHINKDHGINGKSDHSMGDLSEIEHIEYILENYEDIEVGLGSKKYKNRDNSHAKTVVLTAKIENSNIYVVEAVPDTNKKVLKVVSEYKKETALQVNHSKNTPHRTSKNELASAVSNNSIAQESENDNNILKQDSSILYSYGGRNSNNVDLRELQRANEMEKEGKSFEEIFKRTG